MINMTSDLMVFKNEEFGNLRGILIDNEPWFVGKDVAAALGYGGGKSLANAVARHVDIEDKGVTEMMTPGGKQQMTIINESGFYSLILSSKLPSAKKFKRWVTSEVLPALRKTGTYSADSKPDSYMIEDPGERARRWAEEYEQRKLVERENVKLVADNIRLSDDNKVMKPKAEFYDQVSEMKDLISVGQMAALISKNGINISQNVLFEFLRRKGYLCKALHVYNKPTQEMIDRGYMKYNEYSRYDKLLQHKFVDFTPKITGAGQQFIFKKVKDNLGLIDKIKSGE